MFKLEVCVPVLNEEKTLRQNILRIISYLEENHLHHWCVVIADNGSTDSTYVIAREISQKYPLKVRCIHSANPGVGMALRHAWTTSDADVVGYMDLDLSTRLHHLLQIQEIFEANIYSVVNASRLLPGSIVSDRTLLREFLSRGLNFLMHRLIGNRFTDAMCGFKFMNREIALELLGKIPEIPDWFVAAELLVKAEWYGHNVLEIPVSWQDDKESRVKVTKTVIQYTKNICRIFLEKHRGLS